MSNVLVLVLSSRREPWGDLMDVSLATWDADPHPDVQTLYYCAHGSNQLIRDNVRYSAMEDSLENISPRTLEALGWALELPDWKYLARPNSSCYVHKGNLAKHCETLPETDVLRGAWAGGDSANPSVGFLWGGGQYIISRDVVERMVKAGAGWKNGLMDDEAITDCAKGVGVSMNQGCVFSTIDDQFEGKWLCMCYGLGEPFTFTDFADLRKAEGHFFFRVKQDHNRRLDEKLMRELKKNLP
jgi:hypothetical protein